MTQFSKPETFDIGAGEATLANVVSSVVFLPSFVLTTKMYNSMSLRKVLLVCSLCEFVGAWLRMVAVFNRQFWWIVIGQAFIGLSSPMTTCAVSIVANLWFGDQERGRATALMLVSNPLGILVSFSIQAVYSDKINREVTALVNPTPTEEGNIFVRNIYEMLFWETIGTSIGCIYFWIVFRTSKPPTPPSLVAMRRQTSITQGMWNDVKTISKNKNYIIIFCFFSLVYATYAAYGMILDYLFHPLGYNNSYVAYTAMTAVFFGAITAIITGRVLDKTSKYHRTN